MSFVKCQQGSHDAEVGFSNVEVASETSVKQRW